MNYLKSIISDKNNGKDEKFKQINEAYETLYDDDLREQYKIKIF